MAVWEGREHKWRAGPAAAAAARAGAEAAAARCAAREATSTPCIVGYPGHFDMPRRAALARGRPVVFNPLVSLADTLVADRGRFRRGSLRGARAARASTGARCGSPTSSSPTPRRTRDFLADARRAAARAGRRLLRRRGGAAVPPRLAPAGAVHAALRRQADPAARTRDDSRGGAPGAGAPFRIVGCGQLDALLARAARRTSSRCPGSSTSSCRRSSSGPAARSASSGPRPRRARDPEQGVPGARLRRAARHGRHAGGARAARRRRERAARPAGRPGGAGRGAAPARGGRGARAALVARRAGRLRARRRARRCSARAGARCSSEPSRLRPRALLLWAAVAAYAAGFSALSVLRHRAFDDRPLRPRQHGAGGLVDRARASARDHEPRGRADLAARRRTSTRCSSLFAPLWWLWPSPDLLLVGAGGRRSRSARCRSTGSRASTSARSTPRSGSRSRTCSIRRPSG